MAAGLYNFKTGRESHSILKDKAEIIVYQSDDKSVMFEVRIEDETVCKDSLLTAQDGKKYKTKIYNLDVIISVGYRVKSQRGTQFRIWANKVLKGYLLKGYIINQRSEFFDTRRIFDQ